MTTPPLLTSPELGEQSSGLGDLALLPPRLRLCTLVVSAEQQHHLGPVEVDEDSKEDVLRPLRRVMHLSAEHPTDLLGVVADPELMETTAERL